MSAYYPSEGSYSDGSSSHHDHHGHHYSGSSSHHGHHDHHGHHYSGSSSHHGHHHHGQPIVYPSLQGYGQPMVAPTGYYQPGGVMAPQVPIAAPVILPSSYGHHHHHHHHHSFGHRLRRFFGLAPTFGVRYLPNWSSWGFLGYSRRQRYMDPRTGGEVDWQGRPVYRV